MTPEESLLAAVLKTEIADARGKSKDKRQAVRERLRRDAVRWIAGSGFEVLCVELELVPEAVRKALGRMGA